MACYVHATRDATKSCAACGNLICDECSIALADTQICKKCLAEAESVPAIAARPAAGGSAAFSLNWGVVAVPLIIGAISGGVGGMTYHRYSEEMRVQLIRNGGGPLGSLTPFLLGLFACFATGVTIFLVGALWTHMIVPGEQIRLKKGVLGLFGVTDYGKALLLMTVFTFLFWIIAVAG